MKKTKSKDEMFKEMNDSRIKLGLLPVERTFSKVIRKTKDKSKN